MEPVHSNARASNPALLAVDEEAVLWSVPRGELPTALAHRPLLVLMHGYGADERDLTGLLRTITSSDPGVSGPVVASLRAPLPAGPGFAWFPIEDVTRAGSPDPALAAAATAGVMRWLERTQALARTHGPVGLLGFSQGGAMVTHLLRHHPELFACGVVLSGFTVPGLVGGDEALAQIRPPVFYGRGSADPLIPPAAIERTTAFLTAHTRLTSRVYPVGHGIAPAEVDEVIAFLTTHLHA
ncbi:alpha/beta hydrolase [Ruania halotolerans]|uniref:alpha/beta hydrolase n=1 Tax=Ruania halotolerans TaxID=2897773 RepID=UPI001E4D5C3D|nr:dienelactone hydrolase family protein [Ruania halotolerans]UFU08117.1 dienelactone hydrolase family protein [Ruania halotolerans]